MQSGFYSDGSLTVMKGATLSTPPSTGLSSIQFLIHRLKFRDPERPEGIDNCTKDEVRGDFLRPPNKHLTPATVDIHSGDMIARKQKMQ